MEHRCHPQWEIGKETFTRLDGSTYEMWYIEGLGENDDASNNVGGFETEREAITYLLGNAKRSVAQG